LATIPAIPPNGTFSDVDIVEGASSQLQNEAYITILQFVSSRRFVEIVVIEDAQEQDFC